MTKRQQYFWATIITIILLIIFLWIYFKTRKKSEKCPDGRNIPTSGNCLDNPVLYDNTGSAIVTPVTPDNNGCVQPSSYIVNSYPVTLGMKGSFVEQIQMALNNDHNANLKVDGYFGCNTLAAVKKAFGVDTVDAELYKNKILKTVSL